MLEGYIYDIGLENFFSCRRFTLRSHYCISSISLLYISVNISREIDIGNVKGKIWKCFGKMLLRFFKLAICSVLKCLPFFLHRAPPVETYVYGLLIILFMDIFLVKTVYNNKSVFTTNYGVCALRIMSFFLCFISPGFFFFFILYLFFLFLCSPRTFASPLISFCS